MARDRRGRRGKTALALIVALGPVGSLAAQVPGGPPGERVGEVPSIPVSAAEKRCLELPWSEPPLALEAGRPVSSRCEVTESGSLPSAGAPGWHWALYRRTATYEAGPDAAPADRRFFPDTVREDELVLFVVAAAEEPGASVALRPVWHDRSDAMIELLRPPRAAPLPTDGGSGALLAHRRCLSGTGGCADHPFALSSEGTVTPLDAAYVAELRARLPEGWGTWKGVWLDPAGPRAEAGVYLPADANCCPSFAASGPLRLAADTLRLDSLAVVPDEQGGAWWIVPGRSFGHVDAGTSEEALVEDHGRDAVERTVIEIGEGLCTSGARVFPGAPWPIEVAWADSARSRPAFVRVLGTEGPWSTPDGVRLGSTLTELEAIRGGPISFSAFGWDYGGRTWWEAEGGALRLGLGPDTASSRRLHGALGRDPRADELFGEVTVRSDHPLVRELTIRVEEMTIEWTDPTPRADCSRL